MESGNIVEYIDRQKIVCAVVLDVKKQRLRLLSETNREVNLAASRLLHKSSKCLDLSAGRARLVESLREISSRRKALIDHIDIKELWEILNTENEWIDLSTMTEFCFSNTPTDDHESAVARAFFNNRLYFKFNMDSFLPNSQEQVERLTAQLVETSRQEQIIEEGSHWIKSVLSGDNPLLSEDKLAFVDILKSLYLYDKESSEYALGTKILEKAGVNSEEIIFKLLVTIGIWDKNENIDLHFHQVPRDFPDRVLRRANELAGSSQKKDFGKNREDLTSLSLMTIDGQSTLDFDDALSIEETEEGYLLGVHIADVGHHVEKDDVIDREAARRGSSIYMPDMKISMLPPLLAEDLCSLKSGELRPAVSLMVRLSKSGEILDYRIAQSVIAIKRQLSYYHVNTTVDEDQEIAWLYDIGKKFRQKRIDSGAVLISLPEINIWLDENGAPVINRVNRESPGRMLVSEIMIMANWLKARFIAGNGAAGIFRSQPEPRQRLYVGDEGTLFQNWMQRKLLNRFVLSPVPEYHSGLGLDAYVTATSPIRKYFDLVTQRQIRAILGLEDPYSKQEIEEIIRVLGQPMSCVTRIQHNRHRYWLLKYLEGKIGEKEEALALGKRGSNYLVLLKKYLLECYLPLSLGIELRPDDVIQVTLQQVNARKNLISVHPTG
ncbi:MAG: RNB domain-containing ribonuclease [Desulfobacterales bacterium]|nr:RNB domain-containing ribonuclease [Desulfobacterales bacterium]